MEHAGGLSLGKLIALSTLTAVGILLVASGQEMFSPGALNAQSRRSVPLGGVTSHAGIGSNCAACHVAPWSDETMASRCLNCHADVHEQIVSQGPLHGLLTGAMECRTCHTEHQGPHGVLTSLAGFDHDCAAFKLTGQHRSVECASCHVNQVYKGTPHSCESCHAEPEVHLGRFGTDCAECHSTSTWDDAVFAHSFPLNHGRGKRGSSACSVCHQTTNNYKEYTCYGCHKHNPLRTEQKHLQRGIANVQDCALCHPNGRKKKGGQVSADAPSPEPGLVAADTCPSRRGAETFGCTGPHSGRIHSDHEQAVADLVRTLTLGPATGGHDEPARLASLNPGSEQIATLEPWLQAQLHDRSPTLPNHPESRRPSSNGGIPEWFSQGSSPARRRIEAVSLPALPWKELLDPQARSVVRTVR
jgi:hypothetical protein